MADRGHRPVQRWVGVVGLGDPDAAERAALIGAELLGVALSRYLLRLEPLASWPAADVVAAVAPSVQRYLTLPRQDG